MDVYEKALKLHEEWNGKIETKSKCSVKTAEDLSLAYTPGVAEPCREIAKDPSKVYLYTGKANTIAVVSDGSAVLGLGNIGAGASIPVMEGKAVLFKEFGNVNAVPICLDTQDTEEIIQTVIHIAPVFGGINLEDISAPRCFEIEERLKKALDIPVFHDDQHGTAIVVLAGIINGLKVTGKKKEDCKVVVNGAGSAGIAIARLLLRYGFKHLILCDKVGMLNRHTPNMNWMQEKMCEITNLGEQDGSLADALVGADIFIGVSAPNIVTPEMVASMNQDAILFAMANPVPEIMPDVAKAAGAKIVGTGRSDFPNQVNNVVAFPGIFKGALEGHARQITEEMKLAAANAIAGLVSDDELSADNIMPKAFDPRIADVVAAAVKANIYRSGTMSDNRLTLYKLIILFMLDRVDFPLTTSQLSQFILDKGYTNYFNFQQALSELEDAGFIRSELIRNTTQFHLTDDGKEALDLFDYKISSAIKDDVYAYFEAEKINLRNEVEIFATYYPAKRNEYTVQCTILEHSETLLDIKLNVPTLDQATMICDTWQEKSNTIYDYLIHQLWDLN